MSALPFTLELRSALLVAQPTSGEPNSATSLAFIPGSQLRGALIASLLPDGLSPASEPLRRFLSGTTRVLNAYPVHPETGARLLPVPRSWRFDGEAADGPRVIKDLALRRTSFHRPKRPSTAFFAAIEPQNVVLRHARLQVDVHNASDDPNRKDSTVSSVFRYISLAPGGIFAGAILGDLTDFAEIAPGQRLMLWLGGSRNGGYGLAELTFGEILTEWSEAPRPAARSDRTVVTLLSDAILRDGGGAPTTLLSAALGLPAEKAAFADAQPVGGFNRTWGLPLPQTWAVAAGSVFVFDALPEPAYERLLQAAKDGVGERRGEGFGRLAVDWQVAAKHVERLIVSLTPVPAGATALGTAEPAARRLAERRLRNRLDAWLVSAIVAGTLRTGANASQLSRARLAAQQAVQRKDLTPLREHLASLSEVREKDQKRGALTVERIKVGGKQLEAARLNGETLYKWLKARSADKAQQLPEWQAMQDLVDFQVAGLKPEVTPELCVEYTARLVEGVLKRAIKESQRTPATPAAQEVQHV